MSFSFGNSRNSGSNWDFSAPRFSGVSSGPRLTERQILELLWRRENAKPKKSFAARLKDVGEEALDPVLWTLDKLMRPSRAITSGIARTGGGDKDFTLSDFVSKDFWSGAREGFMGREHIGFGELLEREGHLKGQRTKRGLAGFGLDVLVDPLNLLTFGTAGAATKATTLASRQLTREVGAGLTKKQASAALKELKQFGTAFGDDLPKHGALFETKSNLLRKAAFGAEITPADRLGLNILRAQAGAELEGAGRRLAVGLGGPRSPFRVRTPVPLPRMETLGKAVPGVNVLGKAFVPGYGNRVEHAGLMVRKHAGEQLAENYIQVARARLAPFSKLGEKKQREALAHFEKPGGVVVSGGRPVLNPERIAEARKAGLSDDQLAFVQAQHDVSEFLYQQHRQHGVSVEHLGATKGQLYVPRILAKDGNPLDIRFTNMLTERGFRKNRRNAFTLDELDKMKKAGSLPKGVITDPIELMARHLRTAASQHADQAFIREAAKSGRPVREVDSARVRSAESKVDDLARQAGVHPAVRRNLDEEIGQLRKEHETRIRSAFDARDADTANRIRQLLEEDDWQQTTLATAARMSKRRLDRRTKLERELDDLASGRDKQFEKARKALEDDYHAQRAELDELHTKLVKAEKSLSKALRGKRVKDEVGWVELPHITDEFGHKIKVPHEVAAPILRLTRVQAGDDEAVKAFVNGYRKYLGKWKLLVTSVNPGYGVRNTLSDAWNMWISGVPLPQMVRYGGKAAALMRAAKTGDAAATSKLIDAYHHGVLSGLFQGDVQEIQNLIQHAGSKRSLAKRRKLLSLTGKVMQDVNRNRENWGRLTHYLYRLDQTGSVTEAARWTKKAHFDYEDLTDFERNVMKNIAPFYTWTRKNVPYQVQMLLQHPGRFSAFPKFASEMEYAAGEDTNTIVPDWMSKGMYVRLPNGQLVAPIIGVTDLNKLNPANARETASGLLNPMFKVPAEILANQSLLTGRPIVDKTGHPRNPVNDRFASLLSLLPGANVGQTKRQGKTGAGIDPRWSYVFSQIPSLNALLNQRGEVKGNEGVGPSMGYLTGIKPTDVDQELQRTILDLEARDGFQGYLRGLRDEGIIMEPERRKKSKNQQMLDEILYSIAEGR